VDNQHDIFELNKHFTAAVAVCFVRRLDELCKRIFDDEKLWEIYRRNRIEQQYETLREFTVRYLIYRRDGKRYRQRGTRVKLSGGGFTIVPRGTACDYQI